MLFRKSKKKAVTDAPGHVQAGVETVSLSMIRKELQNQDPARLAELCLRIAKYKKENKELLSYLLFEAQDEQAYIEKVKAEINSLFAEVSRHNLHNAKKTIRKILRITNKHIRYSGIKQTAVELLIHFCRELKATGISLHRSTILNNLYERQVEKIGKTIAGLHEDLQYDYEQELAAVLSS